LASAVGVTGVRKTITSGAAFEKLKQMVAAQGGDVRALDDPTTLPSAQCTRELPSPQDGYIAGIDAGILGRTAVALGGGRRRKEDAIDPSVGIVLKAKVGDETSAGQPLLEVHANDAGRLAQALAELPRAYRFSEEPIRPPELVTAIIPPS
jgi:pyrimidine-nucleoside phosphorylase